MGSVMHRHAVKAHFVVCIVASFNVQSHLCKVAPSSSYHVEDVNRAGGVMGIMGELERGGLLDTGVRRVDGLTLAEALRQNDIRRDTATEAARKRVLCVPGGKRCLLMGSQRNSYDTSDLDREKGCIRDLAHAYSKDGGLAVLFGNIAPRGCIVKTAGVDASILRFSRKLPTLSP